MTRSVNQDFKQSIWTAHQPQKVKAKVDTAARKGIPFSTRWQNNSDSLDQFHTASYLELLHKEILWQRRLDKSKSNM